MKEALRVQKALFGCRTEPNTVVMHIRMLDKTAQLQQEAVGVLGINLIHAAFTKGANTAAIIGSLLDELSRARVEVPAHLTQQPTPHCTTVAPAPVAPGSGGIAIGPPVAHRLTLTRGFWKQCGGGCLIISTAAGCPLHRQCSTELQRSQHVQPYRHSKDAWTVSRQNLRLGKRSG